MVVFSFYLIVCLVSIRQLSQGKIRKTILGNVSRLITEAAQ